MSAEHDHEVRQGIPRPRLLPSCPMHVVSSPMLPDGHGGVCVCAQWAALCAGGLQAAPIDLPTETIDSYEQGSDVDAG